MAKKGNGRRQPRAAAIEADRGARQPRSVLSGDGHARIPRSESFTPYHQSPVWAFRVVDLGGPWCWTRMEAAVCWAVLEKLKSFETMTWKEIENRTGSHRVETWRIGKEARDRLVEIRQDDADVLVSLRIDGPGRLWGIVDGHVFRVLWWDPDHQVYPVEKKHT